MQGFRFRIALILVVLAIVTIINFPIFMDFKESVFKRPLTPNLGLDLRGGMQVLLQTPSGYTAEPGMLQVAATILENRSNALGVSEVVFQVAGDNYIVGEFPGLENINEVVDVIKQTGMLEFVDVGSDLLPPGTLIKTDYQSQVTALSDLPDASTNEGKNSIALPNDNPNGGEKIYNTVITGADLNSVVVVPPQNPTDGFAVSFNLKPEGARKFAEHTRKNVGNLLAIVLDKEIISTPVIRQPIETGEGAISGQGEFAFSYDEANNLRVTLFYGSLPVALEIAESRVVGPTLGQASLEKSLIAGGIGFIIVALFMVIYYRAPGFLAILSIALFGLITFALYLIIPVTLTLPGVAGFLLSVGSALDANILQFERLKEELRHGRTLAQAADLCWRRAWPSIRDSNFATILTSTILFWFGSAFGATIVKGFALTLALGVGVSLFTALFVTRTLLTATIGWFKNADKKRWFGI